MKAIRPLSLLGRVRFISQEFLRRYPLLLAALVAAVGIETAASLGTIPRGVWLAAAMLFAGLWWARRFRWQPRWPFVLLITLCFFSWRQEQRQTFIAGFPWRQILLHGGERIMEGRGEVVEIFHPGQDAVMPARLSVQLHELTDATSSKTYHGDWRVLLLAAPPAPQPGQLVNWRARFYLPPPPDNPGQFDWTPWLENQGLSAISELPRGQRLSNEGEADHWIAALRRWCAERRVACERVLTAGITLPDTAGVIKAMVLGVTEDTSPEVKADFQLSGTLHLFSVSGMHVAMVGWVLWFVLRLFGVPKRRSPWVMLPALFLYTAVTGASVPAIRATLMMSVVLMGLALGRRGALLNGMGAAALVLLAWRPEQLHGIGFQLSFVAVAGIAILTPWFQRPFRFWVEPDPFMPRLLIPKWQRRSLASRRWLVGTLAVSAAAMTATAPLLLTNFHLFTPISVIANIPAAILATITMVLALVPLTLSLFSATSALLAINWLNSWVALGLLKSNHYFATVPGGSVYVDHRWATWLRPPLAEVCVLRLPLGGAAVWLRTPEGNWLLDCGARGDHRGRVMPALHSLGFNHLNGLILSHADTRHTGAASLFEAEFKLAAKDLKAGEILELTGKNNKAPFPSSLLCLHPSAPLMKAGQADDRACVWVLTLGKWRVLLSTDAGFSTEIALVETSPNELRADVWIKNQHASDFSGTENFARAIGAKHVIVSSDAKAEDEQMAKNFPAIVEKAGGTCWDQSVTGAVLIRFYPESIEIETTKKSSD